MKKKECSWCGIDISRIRSLVSMGMCRDCDLAESSPRYRKGSRKGQKL